VANNSADTNTFIGHHGNSTHSSNNSLDNIKATSGCTPVLPNTTINRSPAPVPTPISSPVNVSCCCHIFFHVVLCVVIIIIIILIIIIFSSISRARGERIHRIRLRAATATMRHHPSLT
jgi:hypothetical protein